MLPVVTLLVQSVAALGGGDQVGAACVDCHEYVVRSYRGTGMAQALQPIGRRDLAVMPSLEPVDEPRSDFRYHLEVEGGAARIVESRRSDESVVRLGDAGLRFAIGAGIWDRSFAAARDGCLWLAPLEVLTEPDGEHRAVLAPAHEQVPGTRFTMPVSRRCLLCHTDQLPPVQGYPENHEPRGWTPRGISCAACHGAVEAHVTWQEASLSGEDPTGPDPVSTSRKMDRIQRVSVCARCHLQGDVRIPLASEGAGLPPVGDDLLKDVAIWGAPFNTSDIGFVSQAERLVRSPCYTGTADWGKRALSCESCHDPHRSLRDPQERARVRAACTKCHAGGSRAEPGAPRCSRAPDMAPHDVDCVTCHMRLTPVFDLSSVRIHDHRIVTRPPPPSHFERIRTKQATSELQRFTWPDAKPPLAGDPGLEMMARSEMNWADAALELVDAKPAPEVLALPEYHFARGKLLEDPELVKMSNGLRPDRSRLEAAYLAYERALELAPRAADVTMRLVPLCGFLGATDEALARIDALITACPDAPAPLWERGMVRVQRGDLRGAARDYEAAFEKAPASQGALALANVYARLGDSGTAARWRAEAARLDASGQ